MPSETVRRGWEGPAMFYVILARHPRRRRDLRRQQGQGRTGTTGLVGGYTSRPPMNVLSDLLPSPSAGAPLCRPRRRKCRRRGPTFTVLPSPVQFVTSQQLRGRRRKLPPQRDTSQTAASSGRAT